MAEMTRLIFWFSDPGSCSAGWGGTSSDNARSVAVSTVDGSIAVTGDFVGTANFGGSPITGTYGTTMFLAKYTSAGAHTWSRGFSALASYGSATGRAVAFDSVGNIALGGAVVGTVNFDSTYLGGGSNDAMLGRFLGSNG